MNINKNLHIILSIFVLACSLSYAQGESDEDLRKAAQNPIANIMSFPFQNNTNFEMGPDSNRTQNVLNIQPVLPFFNGRLITRTIFPLVWNPDYTQESGSNFGLGDIIFTAFYAPESKGITWGVGPVVQFPSGGTDFGTGKWCAGASVVALAMPGQWVVGALINNIWSFAGAEDRADVNFMTFQPFITIKRGVTRTRHTSSPAVASRITAGRVTATPRPPNRRPRQPLMSNMPQCKRAGASTLTVFMIPPGLRERSQTAVSSPRAPGGRPFYRRSPAAVRTRTESRDGVGSGSGWPE